jgi:hypothetical protein
VKSDLIIENSIITRGSIPIAAFKTGDTHLLKAIASTTDTYTSIKVLEDVTRIAYKVNEMYGNSCADDARIIPKFDKKIRAYVNNRMKVMSDYSYQFHRGKVPVPAGQNPLEYFENMMNYVHADLNKLEILEVIREIMKGSSLQRAGYAKEYEAKLVPAMAARGIILQDGHRPRMELCHNNRHYPFFPKGYDGPEAGYVSDNYLRRVNPVEHWLEGMVGRQDVYTKAGASVQETGYYHRKMYMSIGSIYAGHYGELRGHSATIICFSYGHTGADSRCAVDVSVDAHIISNKEFKSRYECGVPEEYKMLYAIREEWKQSILDYVKVTSDERYDPTEKIFKSPFNVKSFLDQFYSRRSTATATATATTVTTVVTVVTAKKEKEATAQEIWSVMKNMDERFIDIQIGKRAGAFAREMVGERVKAFMRIFRFQAPVTYFLKGKWSLDAVKDAMDAITRKYICSMVQPGDVVGTKAALNITGPLTQASLHAGRGLIMIGKAIDLIRRTHGITTMREVTEGLRPKFPITSFYLDGEDRFDQSKCLEIARASSNVRLEDALVTGYFYSVSPEEMAKDSGNCANSLFLQWTKAMPTATRRLFEKSDHSWFYISLHLNHVTLLVNRVNPALIAPMLREQFSDVVENAIPIYENENGMYVILMLKSTLKYDEMRAAFDDIIDTGIIHGHPELTNGSVKPNEKYVEIASDGSIALRTAYRVMFNGSDLSYIYTLKGIDRSTIVTTDILESTERYGIEEGRFRAYEIMSFESQAIDYLARLLRRHLHVVVSYMAYRGTMTYIPRASVKSNPHINDIDKMTFETADVFLLQALQQGKISKIDSLMSAVLFGKTPGFGSTISQTLIDSKELFPTKTAEVAIEAMKMIPKRKGKEGSTDKGKEKRKVMNAVMPIPMDEAAR